MTLPTLGEVVVSLREHARRFDAMADALEQTAPKPAINVVPLCQDCDRPTVCAVVARGTRPCDRDPRPVAQLEAPPKPARKKPGPKPKTPPRQPGEQGGPRKAGHGKYDRDICLALSRAGASLRATDICRAIDSVQGSNLLGGVFPALKRMVAAGRLRVDGGRYSLAPKED